MPNKRYSASFTLNKILDKMAVIPPVVIPEEKMFRIVSGILHKISGTSSTLSPNEKLKAITRVALRSIF